MPFINPIRCKNGERGTRTFEEIFVSDLSVGEAAAQLDELNFMGLIGPLGSRGKVATFNCQRKGDHIFHNGQCRQNNVYNGLTHNGQHKKSEFIVT